METNHQNEEEDNGVVYAGLGVNNEPDNYNPGSEEAADTLLYTDTATAQHATNEESNAIDDADIDADILDDVDDDAIDAEITELGEEENEGNERY
ncbi:hypothetical protein GCM10027578_07960 [Spirosoma luteolum]